MCLIYQFLGIGKERKTGKGRREGRGKEDNRRRRPQNTWYRCILGTVFKHKPESKSQNTKFWGIKSLRCRLERLTASQQTRLMDESEGLCGSLARWPVILPGAVLSLNFNVALLHKAATGLNIFFK